MSTGQPSRYRPVPWIAGPVERRILAPLADAFAAIGQIVMFVVTVLRDVPFTVRTYPKETMRVLNNLAWGRGSLVVDSGVVSTMLLIGFGMGAMVSIEAFAALDLLGFGALTGVVGGLANIREMCPIAAGIAFAAQAGCRMTAEVGAMRVAEEIDAVESIGVRAEPVNLNEAPLRGIY